MKFIYQPAIFGLLVLLSFNACRAMDWEGAQMRNLNNSLLQHLQTFEDNNLKQIRGLINEYRSLSGDQNAYADLFDKIGRALGEEGPVIVKQPSVPPSPVIVQQPPVELKSKSELYKLLNQESDKAVAYSPPGMDLSTSLVKRMLAYLNTKTIDELVVLLSHIDNYRDLSGKSDAFESLETRIWEASDKNMTPLPVPVPPVVQKGFLLPEDKDLQTLGLCPFLLKSAYEELEPTKKDCCINISATSRICQLNSFDQFEVATEMKTEPAICSVASISNAVKMNSYFSKGNRQVLRSVSSNNDAINFLTRYGETQYITVAGLKQYMEQAQKKGLDISNISVLGSVFFLDKKSVWVAESARNEGNEIDKRINDGFKQETFYQSIILGDEMEAQKAGGQRSHYFLLSISKVGNKINYVVLDSAPLAYHLEGPRLERLKQFINYFERNVPINFENWVPGNYPD